MNNFRRALQYFRPDSARIVLVFGFLLLGTGVNLLKPWPVALIVDCVLGGKVFPAWLANWLPDGKPVQLTVLVAMLLLAHFSQALLSTAHNYWSIQIGLRGLARVRNDVFACLQRLSLRFQKGTKAGDLIHRAAWDTYAFQTLFQQGLVTLTAALVALLLMMAVMLQVNVALAVMAVATVPLLLLVMTYFGRQMRERGLAAQRADSEMISRVQQSIGALPLIQSYTREESEQARFVAQTTQAREKRLAQHRWELLYLLAITAVFGLGMAGIVWLGARQVLAQQLTVGGLLVFLAYLAQLYEPLNQLSQVGSTVATASAGTQRVFELLDTPEEVKDAPNARAVFRNSYSVKGDTSSDGIRNTQYADASSQMAPLVVRGEITFDHVCFAYQKEQPVLNDVSFALGAGESLAIIGPSGVGKTTLLNLLPRFFDPTSGAVRLDGVDLRELRVKDLRQQMALVLQEPLLMPGTIAENIAYGKPGASRGEIEAAARAAQTDEFIRRLPQQYDERVGEGSSQLSVGEKQRLNLARAFLKDAPILLLDEPTSALDSESEARVVENLFELMRGRTAVIIAHRLTTIRRVDKILVLEDGRLTEFGTPAELIQRPGYYARVNSGQTRLE